MGEEPIIVETRSLGSAAPADSSWQTVLPLLDGRPLAVAPGHVIEATTKVELESDEMALRYHTRIRCSAPTQID